jgi:hypothetical protein
VRFAVAEPVRARPRAAGEARAPGTLGAHRRGRGRDALIYEKFLKGSPFQPVAVSNLADARELLRKHRPRR